jgi:CubicO group peptidase (beta-lactamase class C family)
MTVEGSPAVTVRDILSMTYATGEGRRFQYNGERYDRLTEVILKASGQPFAEHLMKRIVRPLGLRSTGPNIASRSAMRAAGMDSVQFAPMVAEPYMTRDGVREREWHPPNFGTAVGIMSSPSDMVRFGMALDEGLLLPKRMVDTMFAPVRDKDGDPLPYALGWFSEEYFGERVLWNFGEWDFASALMIKLPDRRLTFAIVANNIELSEGYALERGDLMRSPIARELFGQVLGLRD